MKKSSLLGVCAILFTFLTVSANAELVGRLSTGHGGKWNQAYYDDQLDITWVQNANINGPMDWDTADSWAAELTIDGVTGWRLPSMDINGDKVVVDCSTSTTQAACADNEYGHLFYYGAGTTLIPSGAISSYKQDPFSKIAGQYWSSTKVKTAIGRFFDYGNGVSGTMKSRSKYFAWAVHDGDVIAAPVVQASESLSTKSNSADTDDSYTDIVFDPDLLAKLDKYEVQGIKLGMAIREMDTILVNAGYSKPTNSRPPRYEKQESSNIKKTITYNQRFESNLYVLELKYRQEFPKSMYLDIETVSQKIKQKYGEPGLEDVSKDGVINLTYFFDNTKRYTVEALEFRLINLGPLQYIDTTLDSESLRKDLATKESERLRLIEEQKKAEALKARKKKPAASADF